MSPKAVTKEKINKSINEHEKRIISKNIKVLMLESDSNDAEIIKSLLKSSPYNCKVVWVTNLKDYKNELENNEFSVILSDHNLPTFSSSEPLRFRNNYKRHIPFILVSRALPEENALSILQQGANDYILKDRPQRLFVAIQEAIRKQKQISDKVSADVELGIITERLRLVGKATADAVWDLDLVKKTLTRGEGYALLFGYKLKNMSPSLDEWSTKIHPDDVANVTRSFNKAVTSKSRTEWEYEYRYLRANGTYAYVKDRGIILRGKQKTAYRMVGAMQDISHIRKLELDIMHQKLHHEKQKTDSIIQAQEEERASMGKEMHDNINQLMAFAKMMIQTAIKCPDMHDECLRKSCEGIEMAIEETRKLSHKLVAPSFTENNSFKNAVTNLADDVNLVGNLLMGCFITDAIELTMAHDDVKLTFYRIIQEQIRNILKYSEATKASIHLAIVGRFYQLVIEDNGIGFDVEAKKSGIGLRNIASRAEQHSGTMKIVCEPNKGCVLCIRIPF